MKNTWRKTGFDEGLGQLERRQRGYRGRFEDHRIAAGDGRSELVGDQVEGVVEGGDREHDSDRHPLEVAAALLAAWKAVEGDGLAEQALGLLAGNGQGVDAAPRLAPRLANGLRTLTGDGDGEILEVVGHDRRGLEEDLRALVGAHCAGHAAGGVGRRERGFDVVGGGGGDGVDQGVVEGIADLDRLVAIHPLAGQQHFHHRLSFTIAMRSLSSEKPVSRRPAPGPTMVTSPSVSVVIVMALVAPPTPASG